MGIVTAEQDFHELGRHQGWAVTGNRVEKEEGGAFPHGMLKCYKLIMCSKLNLTNSTENSDKTEVVFDFPWPEQVNLNIANL